MKIKKKATNQIKKLIGLFRPEVAIKIRYFLVFKKFPNLKHPKTLNEKINVYKLSNKFDFTRYTDKVAVKGYVAEKIGNQYNIPTIFAGEELPSLEERSHWQVPFIIKMNNCSGRHIFVRNEEERNWSKIEQKVNAWKKAAFGRDTGEVHYNKIKPMILVESFLSEKDNISPTDYKVYVLNGKAEFFDVIDNREKDLKACGYDLNWNKLPFSIGTPKQSAIDIPKPKNLDKMIEFAETLAADFPLVRVDFYNLDGKIYFGEMTFTPAAGFEKFYPNQFDRYYGDKLTLPRI